MIFFYLLIATLIGIGGGYASKTLFSADDFSRDAYAYLTNQLSHVLLGACLTIIPMAIGYFATGELPRRIDCFFVLLCGFSALEIVQGGKIFDIIEDIVFTIIYGSGTVLYNFKWTSHSQFEGDLFYFVPCIAVISLHLWLGCTRRRWVSVNANNELDSGKH